MTASADHGMPGLSHKAKVIDAECAAVTGLIVKPFQVENLKNKIATMSNIKARETCPRKGGDPGR